MTLLLFSIEIYPLGKNVNALLELISNSSIKIEYFFFMEGKKAFLVKSNQDGTYKVWHYTNDRQWQPIHNAKEIDGLKEASKNISTISRDLQSETITFGSIIVNSIDDSILNLLKKIENKTITIAGYFWSNKHYDFAFSNKGEARIWNYRYNKKWRPLHNANTFDGFVAVSKTLKDVKFNKDNDTLSIGKIIPSKENDRDYPANAFVLEVQTDYAYNNLNQYTVLSNPSYKYDYSIDCNNDGINEAEHLDGNYTCIYDKIGKHDIVIQGIYPSIGRNIYRENIEDAKMLGIKQWGNIAWKDMEYFFTGTLNVYISANDTPNLSDSPSLLGMLYSVENFNQDISKWDTSEVTDMSYMFYSVQNFNQDISNWDTSNVTDMSGMFSFAHNFNQDISKWDTSNVADMHQMFFSAYNFNQDISSWNTLNVTNMRRMFSYAYKFNQDISSWNTSNVADMNKMFHSAYNFNQDISNWNVSMVLNMSYMFAYAQSFNQDLTKWKMHDKVNTKSMFLNSKSIDEANKPKGISK